MKALRELHLFAGAGGGILAGKLLGHRIVGAVEIDDYCRRVLEARQDDGCLERFPIHDDIRTFDGRPWRGQVDVVAGGFPCQDISTAGKGDGLDGSRSGLWWEMHRVIREVGPRYVFVENVAALLVRGFDRVLGSLADLGFDAEWCVLSAADCGAPHLRRRLWLLARHPNREQQGQVGGARGGSPADAAGAGAAADAADPDANCRRCEGERVEESRGVEGTCWREPDRLRAWREQFDAEVADTNGAGLAQREGAAGERAHPATAGGRWWAAEPRVGRRIDGLAARLDGGVIGEALRELRDGVGAAALEQATRGLGLLQAQKVLLAFVREHAAGGRLPRELVAGQETPRGLLRAMRDNRKADGTPLRREQVEQLAAEHPDALCAMSQLVASRSATPWSNPLWEGFVPRVAAGVANRADRLRALGNAQVPIVAATAWRMLMGRFAS